jgi:RNA polymerase sigma-19 factor, ECF subfamily
VSRDEALRVVSALYVPWYSNLVLYARRVTGSLDMAEDVVQEAFIKLFRSLIHGTTIENPKSWLLCVVRRDAAAECASERRRQTRLDEMSLDPSAADALGLHEEHPSEVAQELEGLFTVLTARELEVLLLRMQALKYKEISNDLGISTNTVKTLLARALRKLKEVASGDSGLMDGDDKSENRVPPTLQ